MKTIAISQSNYIPWKGYFDMIGSVDEFILYDDVQFTRRDWRTRNQIKTPQGLKWLTIPVQSKGNYHAKINAIRVADKSWADEHWKTIRLSYARARYFNEMNSAIATLYESAGKEELLSRVNYIFLRGLCDLLGITTPLKWSMDYASAEGRNGRLISICTQAGATQYLSGPAAKDYMDVAAFAAAGVQVKWMDYGWYPSYEQLFGDFTHGVSVLDVIFNCGPQAAEFVWKRNA
jgi:hypothetical protein